MNWPKAGSSTPTNCITKEGFAETHPAHRGVYDFEVRMRKYANNEEKLAIDKNPDG